MQKILIIVLLTLITAIGGFYLYQSHLKQKSAAVVAPVDTARNNVTEGPFTP